MNLASSSHQLPSKVMLITHQEWSLASSGEQRSSYNTYVVSSPALIPTGIGVPLDTKNVNSYSLTPLCRARSIWVYPTYEESPEELRHEKIFSYLSIWVDSIPL